MNVGGFNLPDVPSDDGFKNGASAIRKQMDLIDDDQLDLLNKQSLSCFSGDNVPFLWCRNDDLCLFDLTLAQMNITG